MPREGAPPFQAATVEDRIFGKDEGDSREATVLVEILSSPLGSELPLCSGVVLGAPSAEKDEGDSMAVAIPVEIDG